MYIFYISGFRSSLKTNGLTNNMVCINLITFFSKPDFDLFNTHLSKKKKKEKAFIHYDYTM